MNFLETVFISPFWNNLIKPAADLLTMKVVKNMTEYNLRNIETFWFPVNKH